MRGRPDLDLRLPPVVHPGDDLVIDLVATSHSETPIDFFDLTFHGELSWAYQDPNALPSERLPLVRSVVRLRDAGKLEEGEHRLTARFTVPRDAPASYLGAFASIRYEVQVHVSIPWWPDLREAYEVLIEPRATARARPSPATAASERGAGEAFIEASIADVHLAPGDEINGAFAVGNLAADRAEGVEVSLVAIEQVEHEGRKLRAEQLRHNVPNVFRVPRGGRETPFRFRVPMDAVPSFQTEKLRLEWILQVILRLTPHAARIVNIPVVVGRHASSRPGAGRSPDVGASRWRAGWSAAGAGHGLVLGEGHSGLVGARGPVQIEVDVHEDDSEVAMAAVFRYPSVLLGLHAAPQLVVLLPSPVELLYPGCKIEQRELAQARAFLGGALAEAIERVKLVSIDDESLAVRAPVTGYDEQGISPFLAEVSNIASALQAALDAIPPPAAMTEMMPAWQAFARETGARLTPGGMAIDDAIVDGALFSIATLFGAGGSASGARVELEVDPPLEVRGPLDLDDPASFVWAPPGSVDIAKALRAKVERLDIRAETLTIELPGPLEDPASVRPLMIEMLVLARRLRGERSPGPYR